MFSQLSKEETKGYDCDEMWNYCQDLYSTFCDSEFNDENMSEIDAMNKFLENIEERIAWCKNNPPLTDININSPNEKEFFKNLLKRGVIKEVIHDPRKKTAPYMSPTTMKWGKMGLLEILADLGKPIMLSCSESKIYIEFANGRVLQLHDDEIENQAEDFLKREIGWLGKD